MAHEAEQFYSGAEHRVEVHPELAGVIQAPHEGDDARELSKQIASHGGRIEGDIGHLHDDPEKPQVHFVEHKAGLLDRFRGIIPAGPFIAKQNERKRKMTLH